MEFSSPTILDIDIGRNCVLRYVFNNYSSHFVLFSPVGLYNAKLHEHDDLFLDHPIITNNDSLFQIISDYSQNFVQNTKIYLLNETFDKLCQQIFLMVSVKTNKADLFTVPLSYVDDNKICSICNNVCDCDSHVNDALQLVCGHYFHLSCINEYLTKCDFCPICYSHIE